MSRERDESFDEIGKKIKREIDAASFPSQTLLGTAGGSGRRQQQQPMFGAAGALAVAAAGGGSILNTITPCAACKLLRRRCAQECPFSPYFSPHEPQKFASVHKVFGASNVSKMLMEVPENQRADAANSLVYEANVRLRDPVYGCMGAISALQQQIQVLQAELTAVRAEILNYKFRRENTMIPSSHDSHVSLFNSGAISMAAEPPLPQPPSTPLPSQQQQVSPPSPTPGPPPTIPSSSSASSIYSSQDASPRTHHRQHHDCDTISNHDHNLSFFG